MVVEDSFEVKVTKETFEPKTVDAEAEKLKATIAISATAYYVDQGMLKKLVIESLSESVGNGSLSEDNLDISLKQQEKIQGGNLSLIAAIQAQLVPEIDEAEIKRSLAGKNLSGAQNYLDNLEEVSEYQVKTAPVYFRPLQRLPFSESRINIKFDN